MKIKVSDLKEFFKRSSKIKSNGIIPIYDYLLFEFVPNRVTIAKSNGNIFCKHTIDEPGAHNQAFFVEEKRLVALVNNAKGEYITFKVSGNKTVLKDERNEVKVEAPHDMKVSLFQKFPDTEGAEKTILNPGVLSALFEARSFASVVESNFGFVYAHKKETGFYVYASNGHLIYLRKFEEELPDLALLPETCSIIATYPHLEYFTSDNYDLFDTGKTLYGFIKTTYRAPEYFHIIKNIDQSQFLTVKKEEVLSFCELVKSLSVHSYEIIKFEAADEGLFAKYEEIEYNVEAEKTIELKKNFWPEGFALNNALFTQILKCFPTEEITLSPSPGQKIFGVIAPEEEGLIIAIAPFYIK